MLALKCLVDASDFVFILTEFKEFILTTKPASVIRKVIVCVNGCFDMLC